MKKVFVLLCLLLVSQSALAGYSLSLYTGL